MDIAMERHGQSWEVFKLSTAASALKTRTTLLHVDEDSGCCARCTARKAHIEGIVADAGQFYDAVTVEEV